MLLYIILLLIMKFTWLQRVYLVNTFFYHTSHNFKKVINNSSRATGCDRSGDIWGELFSLFVHCLSSNIRVISWGKQTTVYCYNIPVDMLMMLLQILVGADMFWFDVSKVSQELYLSISPHDHFLLLCQQQHQNHFIR